jgi:tetratricopeptide (TPR) repeat protein
MRGLLVLAAALTFSPVFAQNDEGDLDELEEGLDEDEGEGDTPDVPPPETPPPEAPPPEAAPPPKAPIAKTGTTAAKAPPKRTPPKDRPLPVFAPPPPPSIPTEADLMTHIEARASAVRLGDRIGADVELALLQETRSVLGSRNVLIASAALINEAKVALEAKDGARAIQLAEAAAQLSPDLVAAHWMRVRVYYETDWTQITAIGAALSDLVGAQIGQFRNLLSLLSRLLMLLGIALMGTVGAFVLIQSIKYFRYPAFDFASLMPRFFGTGEMLIVLTMLVSMPLVLGLGLAVTAGAALTLIYAYQSSRERAVSTVVLILMAVGPGIVHLAAPVVTFHGSLADSMATAISEAFAFQAEERLRAHAEGAGRRDFDTAMVLANLERRRGDLTGAELHYRRALDASPQSPHARNNLGTIQYLLGQREAAKVSFTQARNQRIAEPFLNLASIEAENGDFDTAKSYLEQARKIDEPLTVAYTRLDSSVPISKKLLEAPLEQSLLWLRLFDADTKESLAVTSQIWRTVGGYVPPIVGLFVMVGLLAIAVMLHRRSDRLSTPCPKCGIPADRGSPAHYCSQCHSVFLTAVTVEPGLRRAKEEEVRRFQRRKRIVERILSMLAGVGQLYAGQPIVGMILVFLFLLAIGNIVFADYLSVHPWSVWIDPTASFTWSVGSLVVAGMLVVISIRHIANQR